MDCLNDNCDYAGPHASGSVAALPLGAGVSDSVWLCKACWDREMAWRSRQNKTLPAEAMFAILPFSSQLKSPMVMIPASRNTRLLRRVLRKALADSGRSSGQLPLSQTEGAQKYVRRVTLVNRRGEAKDYALKWGTFDDCYGEDIIREAVLYMARLKPRRLMLPLLAYGIVDNVFYSVQNWVDVPDYGSLRRKDNRRLDLLADTFSDYYISNIGRYKGQLRMLDYGAFRSRIALLAITDSYIEAKEI